MAYQLSTNEITTDPRSFPQNTATDSFFAYPTPSSLNNCCRASTMLYGTAPYKAGKGAPNNVVMIEDMLRPQSTTTFNKGYVNNLNGDYFPIMNVQCSLPVRPPPPNPDSTRSMLQNGLFTKRYCQ